MTATAIVLPVVAARLSRPAGAAGAAAPAAGPGDLPPAACARRSGLVVSAIVAPLWLVLLAGMIALWELRFRGVPGPVLELTLAAGPVLVTVVGSWAYLRAGVRGHAAAWVPLLTAALGCVVFFGEMMLWIFALSEQAYAVAAGIGIAAIPVLAVLGLALTRPRASRRRA